MGLSVKAGMVRLIAAAGLLAVVPAALWWTRAPSAATAVMPADAGTAVPLAVSTYIVEPTRLAETVSATGTLRADEAVELQAEASGKVVAINFVEGRRVRKGELLVKINDEELQANLARATHRMELAQARERRLATLLAQKLVAQHDYESVHSELQVQEAEIGMTRAQIARTEIRAPFDGVVGLRFVSVGAYVGPATRIATLQQVERLKLDFSLPEKYAARIRSGSPVTFRTADGEQHRGQIYAVDPRIDTSTRTVLGRAVCRNDGGRLLPGAFASIEIELSSTADALLIPAQAVVPGLDEHSVFVLHDGRAQRRQIRTGTRSEGTVQVTAGLVAGETVITSGLMQIKPGQRVAALVATTAITTP